MQNLFICKFSALKIQFFPSVSVLPPSRAPLSFHPPRHPASFLVGTRSLALVELGLLCTQHGTGKAWLTSQTGCARHSVRGSPGSPNGMWRARFLFGECGLSRTIIIFGDCTGGRLLSNLYPEKVLPRRLWAQDTLGGESAPDGRGTLVGAREHQTGAEPF